MVDTTLTGRRVPRPVDNAAQTWAEALQVYRRSLDLYRDVLALRVRREARLLPLQTDLTSREVPDATSAARIRPGPYDSLTSREREVAQLMARGYTNQQIAEALVLTRGTAANHVAHILAKLGATNRTQVAALVLRRQASPHTNGVAVSGSA